MARRFLVGSFAAQFPGDGVIASSFGLFRRRGSAGSLQTNRVAGLQADGKTGG